MSSSLLDHVVIGKETTFKTAVVPSIQLPVAREGGISTEISVEEKSELRSVQAKHNAVLPGSRVHAGSFKMDLFKELAGHIFLSALGSVTSGVVGGETIVYEHDFTEATTKPSYTVEQKLGALTRRFAGTIFNTFKIIAEAGSPSVMLEFEAIASANDTASPVTPSAPVSKRFLFDNVALSIASTLFDQATKVEIEHISGASIINTLNASKDPSIQVCDGSEVQITAEFILDSALASKYQEMLNDTEQRVDLVLTGSETIGTGSNPKLELGMATAKITAGETTQVGEGAALLPITIRAYSETGSVYDVFKLTNLTTTY